MSIDDYYDPLGRPKLNPILSFFAFVGLMLLVSLGLVLVFGSGVSNCTGRTHELAQKEADKYLREMGIEGRARCVGVDSDGDGYVSCPYVTFKDGATHPLECAGAMTLNSGCRPPKAVFTQTVVQP